MINRINIGTNVFRQNENGLHEGLYGKNAKV